MNIFNEERSAYYKAKKRELTIISEHTRVIREDALFVHYYGMSSYLDLFPEARDFGMEWHNELIKELQRLKNKELAQLLSGISIAYAANKSKKSRNLFKRIIGSLTK